MHRYLVPLVLSLYLVLLSACSGAPQTQAPRAGGGPAVGQDMPEAAATPKTITPLPSPTPARTPAPTPTPDSMPVPVATPARVLERDSSSPEALWVRDRLTAVVSLYDITPAGFVALDSLDVRWMKDQPGFFGSYGYRGWAGVGEAKPTGVMHELGHSYWGLFPVTGLPHLDWDTPKGKELSSAMERYHQDILQFMAQPPDHFELLRSRLRNLPELSADNTEPLYHTLEADAVYVSAGDLALIPPILRKYWDRFLHPGPFHSWYEAFRWYEALPSPKVTLADKYIGFEHFDLTEYSLMSASEPTRLGDGIEEILVREETERLRDFVDLFDVILATTEHKEDFKFWRRYLRDKIDLHRQYPELVGSTSSPRSRQIGAALDVLNELKDRDAEEVADVVIKELGEQAFLAHFLPALDNRTLMTVFTSDATLPEIATFKGTEAFVDSLKKFAPHIDRILEVGRDDSAGGAEELKSYLNSVDFEDKEELELFFEIFQGSDRETAKEVTAGLDDSVLRSLIVPVPVKLRELLTPSRFLEFLEITLDSSAKELAQGIEDMMRYPSGNFRIDEPFLNELYKVVVARGRIAPLETLNIVTIRAFPVERFISLHPAAAVDIMAGDLDITAKMVTVSDPVTFPPARFVYRLIYADPEFAARLVERLSEQYGDGPVVQALAHFAYDAARQAAVPSLAISLERDGRFLKRLLEVKGGEWLEHHISEAVELYRQHVERNESPGDFLAAYERTLRAAAAKLDDTQARRTLKKIIGRAFD